MSAGTAATTFPKSDSGFPNLLLVFLQFQNDYAEIVSSNATEEMQEQIAKLNHDVSTVRPEFMETATQLREMIVGSTSNVQTMRGKKLK